VTDKKGPVTSSGRRSRE